MSTDRLTKQQRKFCEAYVFETDGNGTWAAWRAGCSNTDPDVEPTKEKKAQLASEASRLLKRYPHVRAYIAELRENKAHASRARELAPSNRRPVIVTNQWQRSIKYAQEYLVTPQAFLESKQRPAWECFVTPQLALKRFAAAHSWLGT